MIGLLASDVLDAVDPVVRHRTACVTLVAICGYVFVLTFASWWRARPTSA